MLFLPLMFVTLQAGWLPALGAGVGDPRCTPSYSWAPFRLKQPAHLLHSPCLILCVLLVLVMEQTTQFPAT